MDPSLATSGAPAHPIRVLIVAGPSGSGKTTVGRALAQRLGWAFEDADDYHTPEAKAIMGSGIGLTDADRAPWLSRLSALIQDRASGGPPTVLACSALTAAYRQRLRTDGTVTVWLHVSESLLRQRLASRRSHFAGVDLITSQLATAEAPAPEEAIVVDGSQPVAVSVEEVMRSLGREGRDLA